MALIKQAIIPIIPINPMDLTTEQHILINATLDALYTEQVTQDEAISHITQHTPLTPDDVLALIAEMTDDVITEPK